MPYFDRTPPEGPCNAPVALPLTYCRGWGILWNDHGERACSEHQQWLARPRTAAARRAA